MWGEMRSVYKTVIEKPEVKRPLEDPDIDRREI
jgi:hypothetical protein